ncbi:hypothetical protein ANCDUO_04949, partial [Ancylostoma duodenale]
SSREELHLRIERVNLEDDGQFECQMLRPDEGPIRAAAYLNVIGGFTPAPANSPMIVRKFIFAVAPKHVHFANYQSGAVIDVNEEISLNLTCVVPNAKPEASLTW